MGSWTIVIQGTGAHHNFKRLEANKLVPDGEGDYERNFDDADHLAAKFVRELKSKGQTVTSAHFYYWGNRRHKQRPTVLTAEA